MKKLSLRMLAPLLLFALCAAPYAAATTLMRMTLAQLARSADTIARVRCVSSAGQWDNCAIWTFSEFEVVERFKGAPPNRIRVRVPGGRVGHLMATIEATPKFLAGKESVLFLETTPAGDYSVTAWVEGTFRIDVHPQTTREAVTQESSSFLVFDAATRSFRAEGIRNLAFGEFRQRLAAALAQPARGAQR